MFIDSRGAYYHEECAVKAGLFKPRAKLGDLAGRVIDKMVDAILARIDLSIFDSELSKLGFTREELIEEVKRRLRG